MKSICISESLNHVFLGDVMSDIFRFYLCQKVWILRTDLPVLWPHPRALTIIWYHIDLQHCVSLSTSSIDSHWQCFLSGHSLSSLSLCHRILLFAFYFASCLLFAFFNAALTFAVSKNTPSFTLDTSLWPVILETIKTIQITNGNHKNTEVWSDTNENWFVCLHHAWLWLWLLQ